MSASTPSSTNAPSIDRIGQLISGRYRICSLIGEGGMGAVYLAEHTHMRKRFALKLLHPQMAENKEVVARFQREAEAAAHVEHQNIVAATDFGPSEDGAFFLVLEYVDGITLRATLASGALSAARSLYIARQIALALERAHGAGIVHRDLKPENVMLVTRDEDRDFVKVLDFGVARFESPSAASGQFLTQAGAVMGTPQYMAPEQAVGDRVGPRADLYALGCVLYEMLTGEVPFDGDVMELLSKHLTAPVPPMSERTPGIVVPAPVEALARKLLEKDANNRYPTARALVDAIDQVAFESGIEVFWGPPSSQRIAVAGAGRASVVAPSRSASQGDAGLAKTVHLGAQGAAPPGLLGRLEAYRSRVAAASAPARARAAALYRAEIAPRLAPVLARADVLLGRVATRAKLPKSAVLGILGGAFALLLLASIVVVVIVRREPLPTDGGLVAKVVTVKEAATPEEIRAAAIKGPAALEELATTFPKDPAVSRELAFSYDSAGRSTDALRVVRLMAETDAAGLPPDVIRIVIRAASKVEVSDEAFRLLEGPLGSGGVDALFELAERKDIPSSTSSRAQSALAKATVRANASPSAAFILDLRAASTCEERHDLLVQSGSNADARASAALRALETRYGCGRRGRYDCNPCLRKDEALAGAIEAARSHSEH
jgi:serine/threonine-protein kinase